MRNDAATRPRQSSDERLRQIESTKLRLLLFCAVGWICCAQSTADEPVRSVRKQASSDSEFAWQSTDKYIPPNFDSFFPDDAKGGLALDSLYGAADKNDRSADEILETVRTGLRRTRHHRSVIMRWIGNRYIWNESPQNAVAIEMVYHAADFSGLNADPYGTRHNAVYFGLSTVQPKTPAILRTLVDLCMRVDDPNDIGRVAWGTSRQRAEVLELLKPHVNSDDATVRRKAEALRKIFTEEMTAREWAQSEWQRKRGIEKAKWSPVFLEIAKAGYVWQATDNYTPPNFDSFFPDDGGGGRQLAELFAAEDRDSRSDSEILQTVRSGLRRTTIDRSGVLKWVSRRFMRRTFQSPDAIEVFYHAADFSGPRADPYRIRNDAVYFGIKSATPSSPAIMKTLVEMSMRVDDPNIHSDAGWVARIHPREMLELLKPHLKSPEAEVRSQAQGLEKVFKGELDAMAWNRERIHKREADATYSSSFRGSARGAWATLRTLCLKADRLGRRRQRVPSTCWQGEDERRIRSALHASCGSTGRQPRLCLKPKRQTASD